MKVRGHPEMTRIIRLDLENWHRMLDWCHEHFGQPHSITGRWRWSWEDDSFNFITVEDAMWFSLKCI